MTPTPTNTVTEDYRPIRVQVSVLCGHERHGWINPHLVTGLMSWAGDQRVTHPEGQFYYVPMYGFASSQEARNRAFDIFLDPGNVCEYLLMIDNDTNPVLPSTGELLDLLALPNCNLPIVAAAVPTVQYTAPRDGEKTGAVIWGINAYKYENEGVDEGSTEPGFRMYDNEELGQDLVNCDNPHQTPCVPVKKVDAVGFGAVCIRKDVALAMRDNISHTYERPGRGVLAWKIWKDMPADYKGVNVLRSRASDGSTIFGEDLLYCWRAKDIGFHTYCAPTILCDHIHSLDMGRLPHMQMALRPELAKQRRAESQERRQAELYRQYGFDEPRKLLITDWSMDPRTVDSIVYKLNAHKKQHWNILELGSGISTLAIAQQLLKNGKGMLYSVEEDAAHANAVRQSRTGLEHQHSTIYTISIDSATNYYHAELLKTYIGPVWMASSSAKATPYLDMLIIDGPSGKHQSRAQALQLFPYLKHNALIVVDDCERDYERKMVDDWFDITRRICTVGRAVILRFDKDAHDLRCDYGLNL